MKITIKYFVFLMIFIAILCVPNVFLNAQVGWQSTSGNDGQYILGKVGIGTTNPINKLEVNGNISIGDGSSVQGAIRLMPGGTNSYFWIDNPNANYLRFSNGTTAGTNPMILTNSGSVGIGTTSPFGKLTVAGIGNDGTAASFSTGSTTNMLTIIPGTSVQTITTDWGTGGSETSIALGTWNNRTNQLYLATSGKVGIGTTNPTNKLEVNGNISIGDGSSVQGAIRLMPGGTNSYFWIDNPNANYLRFSNGATAGTNPMILTNSGSVGIGTTSPFGKLAVAGTGYNGAAASFSTGSTTNVLTIIPGTSVQTITTDWGTGGSETPIALGTWSNRANQLYLATTGKVGIGTTTMGNCKLAVEGMIGAREVQVVASGWPDFVFDESYELTALDEVEYSIKTEKHLPGIPSKEEVVKDGVKLGEMQTKLLQKVEELTLYVIEQNKKIDNQGERIQRLERDNEELRKK